jgi:beta-glucanase (GH16 family)
MNGNGNAQVVKVSSNTAWTVATDAEWCAITPESSSGNADVSVSATANNIGKTRSTELVFTAGSVSKKFTVIQEAVPTASYVPAGYTLVWQDEFNDPRSCDGKAAIPNNSRWLYDIGHGINGWGNNELQYYIPAISGRDTCAKIDNGTLKIIAKKAGNQVLSVKMKSRESWLYGYFEARMKMPSGRGTWPALWMMPAKDVEGWPFDGEIDIMEYVGYRPNTLHCNIHTGTYSYFTGGSPRGASRDVSTAETDFHVYAMEWTPDYIRFYINGVIYRTGFLDLLQFSFDNDNRGNKNTWPFNVPFFLILNLAWGGDWGGTQGVDESKLPATYEIDYIRVYQRQ